MLFIGIIIFLTASSSCKKENASTFSDKLVDEITLSITQAITSVQNLDLKHPKLELAVLAETNTLARDLQHVVYELRKLLANHYGKTTVNDNKLTNSANSLAKIVNDLQATLTTDVTNIKTQLLNHLAKLPREADNLSSFVKSSSDENDNTKMIYILITFLTGVFRVKTRNDLEQLSKTEIRKNLKDLLQRQLVALHEIDSNDEKTYNDLVNLGRRAVEKVNNICEAIDDDAEFFQSNTREMLHEISAVTGTAMNYFNRTIHISENVPILLIESIVCTHRVYDQLDALLETFVDASNDFDMRTMLRNAILTSETDSIACGTEYTLGVENIVSRQK